MIFLLCVVIIILMWIPFYFLENHALRPEILFYISFVILYIGTYANSLLNSDNSKRILNEFTHTNDNIIKKWQLIYIGALFLESLLIVAALISTFFLNYFFLMSILPILIFAIYGQKIRTKLMNEDL
jgi:hypothetical protein